MFYNTHRATRAAKKEYENSKLSGVGQNIVNPREKLMNLQKRQKLKDLLITKFMQKYGIKHPEQILENEITKFLQGEKLNDADLQRLDNKIRRLLNEKKAKENLKSSLTNNLGGETIQKPVHLAETNKQPTFTNNIPSDQIPNVSIYPNKVQPSSTLTQTKKPATSYGYKSNGKFYHSPEEELADLEKEWAEEEAKFKPTFKRIDFSKEGDEWNAMAQYNKKLYDQELLEEKIKDKEIKRRTKEDLDNQVKQKIKREYEQELKDKEYDKIIKEHQKKLDEIERKKAEDLKKQVLREKANRDAQVKDEYVRKRIDELKEKKLERELVKNIIKDIENEKKEAIEKKN